MSNVENFDRKVKTLEDFMRDIERAGGKVPKGLKRAVDRYILAAKFGRDAAEAAQEVDIWVRKIYQDMYLICREEAATEDDYWVCRAGVDRQFKARNVKAVLDWNDDRTWVSRTWDKWKKRLAEMLEDEAKSQVKKRVNPEVVLQ